MNALFRLVPHLSFSLNWLPIFGLLILLLLNACSKPPEIALPWTEQISGTDALLTSVFFTDDTTGHVVGGKTFELGIYLSTEDAGQHWRVDSIHDKLINSIHITPARRGHNAGIKGLFRSGDNVLSTWFQQGLAVERSIPPMNDVFFWDNEQGLVVGGAAFQNGYVLRLGADYEILAQDSFDNELSAVCYSDDTTAHIVGFGIVLRSTDSGFTWQRSTVSGDFFRSVHFPSSSIGYAVGYFGTILKTEDAGQNWVKLRDGDKLSVSDEPFRSVYFVDPGQGYIVGDDGLFWLTRDGGATWQVVGDFPEVDLYEVFVINGQGYIVGASGRIFNFSD
ncbi:MAG: YCF48-related protein [Bacteroidota bacterium]